MPAAPTARPRPARDRGGRPLVFTAEIGEPPVRLMAAAGQCAPAAGQACATIPAGTISVNLVLEGQVIGRATANVPQGREVYLETVLDNGVPRLLGALLPAEERCADIGLVEIGDGGAPQPRPDGGTRADAGVRP
jgi:hypothetical protein